MTIDTSQCQEARAWLAKNGSESGFASNRFGPTEAARTFVEEVYSAGAAKVLIPNDAIRDDEEEVSEMGGPYADALVIELPASGREKLYSIFESEAAGEGYEEMTGAGSVIDGRFLYLWWD
jgi:hypothetical protein